MTVTKTLLQTKIHNLTVQRDSNMNTIAQLEAQRTALADETNSVHGSIIAYQQLLEEMEAAEGEAYPVIVPPKPVKAARLKDKASKVVKKKR